MVLRIWKEAWIEEKHEENGLYLGNGPITQKTSINPRMIHLFSYVSSQQEMAISVFHESQRERKLFKWASNCGLEETPYKKSVSNFPLTSLYTQHISTSNQNINILLDFKCPLTCLCSFSARYVAWFLAEVQMKAPYSGPLTFYSISASIVHHKEP